MATRDSAWQHCDKDPEKEGMVTCKICKTKVSIGSKKSQSIAAFKRHLKSHHFTLWEEICGDQGTPSRGQKRPAEENSSPFAANTKKARQTLFQQTLGPGAMLENVAKYEFNSEKAQSLHKLVLEWLIVDMVPFNKTNGAGFLRMMKGMNPKFEVASRQFYSGLLEPTYQKLKKALREVQHLCRIAITGKHFSTHKTYMRQIYTGGMGEYYTSI